MPSSHSEHLAAEARVNALIVEIERLELALFEAHRRIDEYATGSMASTSRPRDMALEVRDLLRTRTFRWTRLPRRIYALLRYGNARRVPPIPD